MRHMPHLLRQIVLAAGVATALFALPAEGQAADPVCWVDVDRTNALATRGAAQDGDFAAAVRKLLARTCKAGNPLRGYVPYAANAPAGPKPELKAVLKSKTMWKVMLCGGLSVGAAILLNSYAVNAFIGKGMEPGAASVIATIMNFCLLVGGLVAGFIVTKAGRYNLPYVVICLGGAILYYIAYWLPTGIVTYVLIGVAAFVVAGSIGVNMGRIALIPVTDEFGPENIGAAGGMNQTAVGLIGFVLPTIVASIFGTNYMGVWTFAAIILILIGILGGMLTPELGPKGKLAQKKVKAE